MAKFLPPNVRYVARPDGLPLTLGDLPHSNQQRWVPRLKANVVFAVRGGLISLEEACSLYRLTRQEFAIWEQALDLSGMRGLRVTRIRRDR